MTGNAVGKGHAQLVHVSAGRDGPIPRLQGGLGNAGTDATIGTGYKPNFAHIILDPYDFLG
jgi:hypothetical protein